MGLYPTSAWRLAGLPLAAATVLLGSSRAAAQVAPDSGIAITGTVIDSIRGRVLTRAIVQLRPAGREAFTDSTGRFRFTGVRPGEYTLRVLHPLLDTLGIAVVTPTVRPSDSTREFTVDIAVPPVSRLLPTFCTPAQMLRGPAVLLGVIRDPDTELPVDSAQLTLQFDVNQDPLGLVKTPAVRQTMTDRAGRYHICGLPTAIKGRLQIERRGVKSADMPLDYENTRFVVRGVSFSLSNSVVAVAADSGRIVRLMTGPARLTGRVLSKAGEPVEGARVTVVGSNSVGRTRANGTFSLDSLPVGSQVVEVRKVGFGVTEKGIELSGVAPQNVEVAMNDFVPTLDTVRAVSIRERDLEKVGFIRRRNSAGGYHYQGDQLHKGSESFTQSLIGIPSVKVVRSGEWSDEFVIQDSRDPRGGCVVFFVDGQQWKTMRPGDIDEFVRPYEVEALEVYRSGTVPGEFAVVGRGRCLTLVIWTRNKIRGGG